MKKGRTKGPPTPKEVLETVVPETLTQLVELAHSSDEYIALQANLALIHLWRMNHV